MADGADLKHEAPAVEILDLDFAPGPSATAALGAALDGHAKGTIRAGELMRGARLWRRKDAPLAPTVSVIFPTYMLRPDGSNHVAIRSVLEQTFTDWELILIDDGSTDRLFEELRNYQKQDSRILVIRHECNCGLPGLRANEGILQARGELIAYMFEDDFWMPNALEALIETHRSSPEGNPVYGIAELISDQHPHLPSRRLGDWDFNYGTLKGGNRIANCTVLHPRTLLWECGLYDPHILARRNCDWDLWLRISRQRPFVRCRALVARVRSLTSGSLGRTVILDLHASVQWYQQDRDALLHPDTFQHYSIDSLAGLHANLPGQYAGSQSIRNYLERYAGSLSVERALVSLACRNRGRSALITKTDYSTSVDVTIRNFQAVLAATQWSHGFLAERDLGHVQFSLYDTLLLYRTVNSHVADAANRARELGKTIVYQIDDNMLQFGTGYMAAEFEYLVPGSPLHRQVCAQITMADLVISYSPYITDDCSPLNPRIIELRTNIPGHWIAESDLPEDAPGRRIRYAILTGEARRRELKELWTEIARFASRHADQIEIYCWGFDTASLGQLACPVSVRTFTHSYDEYLRRLADTRFDFVICPLFGDHPTKLSKSPIKYLEATVAGAVGLYSDVPPYREVPDTACLKVQDGDWLNALEYSVRLDRRTRRRMHDAAKSHILKRFTTEIQIPEFLAAFEAADLHALLHSRDRTGGRPTIAYFFHETLLGGATLHLLSHARLASTYGCVPVICVWEEQVTSEFATLVSAEGLRLHKCRFSCSIAVTLPRQDAWTEELSAWMLNEEVALVHAVTWCPEVFAAANRLEIPSVVTLHAYYDSPKDYQCVETLPSVDAIHSSSQRYASKWSSVLGDTAAFCIRAPIHSRLFDQFSTRHARTLSAEPFFVISGTLQPRKRQLEAIEAIALLHRRGLPARLDLIGYDDLVLDYVLQCNEAIDRLGMRSWVRIIGFRSDSDAVYSKADFLLCASDDESMPQTILKAMAMGLRVVSTDVGGVTELVRDRQSGVIAISSSPKDLADAMQRAIEFGSESWGQMLENAHATARVTCTVPVVAQQLLGVYTHACRQRQAKRRAPDIVLQQGTNAIAPINTVTVAPNDTPSRLLVETLREQLRTMLFKQARREQTLYSRLRRLRDPSDAWGDISPLFEDFKADLERRGGRPKGYRLGVSRSLSPNGYQDYPILGVNGSLQGVEIAPIIELHDSGGVIGVEIIDPAGHILANRQTELTAVKEHHPLVIGIEPIPVDARPGWRLRIFVQEADAPIRVFEFHRPLTRIFKGSRRTAFVRWHVYEAT